MIRGYPARPSVGAGGDLVLHVSTDAPRFKVRLCRWGDGFTAVDESGWLEGTDAPGRGPAEDWGWPPYAFPVSPHWPPGVYVAHLLEPGGPELDLALDRAAALFVVRGAPRSRLLYKLPLCTYQAYNTSGGGCFYDNPARSHDPPGSKVSFHRPGGGIGGIAHGAPDAYDESSPRSTFAHYDAPFLAWLARRGYEPDVCADLDLHRDPSLCGHYRLIVSAGHDEYWSEPVRDAVEAFVGNGGNAAFFGANLCWWRVHVVDDGTAIVCHQGGPHGARDLWWPASGAGRPEDALTGVSYRHGGGWWDGPRRTQGFVVQAADHWAFAGTGLRRGARFGASTSPPLVGYECDGAPLEHFDARTGEARLAADATRTGTPPTYELLAVGPLGDDWQELPPREGHPAGGGVHAATLGIFRRNGLTFCSGTTDWPQVLAGGHDPVVDTITVNVLDRLLQ